MNAEKLCHQVNHFVFYSPPLTSYTPISLSTPFPLFIEHFQKQIFSAKMKQQQNETMASVEMRICCWIFQFRPVFPKITSILVVLLPCPGQPGGESAPAPPPILVLCTRACITLAEPQASHSQSTDIRINQIIPCREKVGPEQQAYGLSLSIFNVFLPFNTVLLPRHPPILGTMENKSLLAASQQLGSKGDKGREQLAGGSSVGMGGGSRESPPPSPAGFW